MSVVVTLITEVIGLRVVVVKAPSSAPCIEQLIERLQAQVFASAGVPLGVLMGSTPNGTNRSDVDYFYDRVSTAPARAREARRRRIARFIAG